MDSVTEMTLSYEYDLTKNTELTTLSAKHKFVVEMISGSLKIVKEFEFEAGLFNKASTFADFFTLNLYDQFEDHKILIGTSNLKWFIEN